MVVESVQYSQPQLDEKQDNELFTERYDRSDEIEVAVTDKMSRPNFIKFLVQIIKIRKQWMCSLYYTNYIYFASRIVILRF